MTKNEYDKKKDYLENEIMKYTKLLEEDPTNNNLEYQLTEYQHEMYLLGSWGYQKSLTNVNN